MRSRFFTSAAVFALLVFAAPPVQAQLAGTDTAPGDSCAGFPDGATRMVADPDGDLAEVILICDGTTWNASAGGGGTPAGDNTQIQFNDAGAFGASSIFVWNKSLSRLGVGASSPTVKLDVAGAVGGASIVKVRSTSTSGYSAIDLFDNANVLTAAIGYANSGTASLADLAYFGSYAAKDLVFFTNGASNERMRITASGNMLLSNPSTNTDDTLPYNSKARITIENTHDVNNVISTFDFLHDGTPVGAVAMQTTDSNMPAAQMMFYTRGSDGFRKRMTLTTEGNVGIGTESPDGQLHIEAPEGDYLTAVVLDTDTKNAADQGPYLAFRHGGQDVGFLMGASGTGNTDPYLALGVGAENVRINKDGNVGVGTGNPRSTLHVPDGKYPQFEDNNAGPPPAADCDSDTERGRQSIDTANNRLYICNGAARGWDYLQLIDAEPVPVTMYSMRSDASGERMTYDCGSAGCTPVDDSTDWTVEFYANCDNSTAQYRDAAAFENANAGTDAGAEMSFTLETNLDDQTAWFQGSNQRSFSGVTEVDQAGSWHRYSFVWNASADQMTMYVDGVQKGTASDTGTWTSGPYVTIGSSMSYPGNISYCYISDVRVWTVARTQAQIQTSDDCVVNASSTGLWSNWIFEGSGTNIPDRTANARNGTLSASGIRDAVNVPTMSTCQ